MHHRSVEQGASHSSRVSSVLCSSSRSHRERSFLYPPSAHSSALSCRPPIPLSSRQMNRTSQLNAHIMAAPDNPDPDPAASAAAAAAAVKEKAALVASAVALARSNLSVETPIETKLPHPSPNANEAAKKAAPPRAEIIGDELKSVILDPTDPAYGRIARVCILDVDRNWTIEAIHGHALKKPAGGSAASATEGAPANVDSSASTSCVPSEDGVLETDSGIVIYPHDADVVLKNMDPEIHVETVYLRPDVRQSIAAIRRRKHTVDVFINLYDRADETGQKIVDYMVKEGLAFTGAGSRFYDPTRMELKRLCRYNKIPTPAFAIIVDSSLAAGVPEQLGGFPLFVKPEHGYDSVGIDEKSLIWNVEDLCQRVAKIVDEFGSALVEQYVDGREFSVLVAGAKGKIQCFPPVEYRFPKDRQPGLSTTAPTPNAKQENNHNASVASTPSPTASPVSTAEDSVNGSGSLSPPLPSSSPAPSSATATPASGPTPSTSGSSAGAAFITFDDKWGANFENRWFLLEAGEETLGEQLMNVSQKLYEAFDGEGLARFDIRVDRVSGKLMVLDVNPNCSLFYKDECTADTILRLVPHWSKERFMHFLIEHAFERQRAFHRQHSYVVKYSEERGFSLHASRSLKVGDLVYSDEESPLRLVTRSYALSHWNEKEMNNFDAYAWPVGEGVFAIWDEESSKWKPINHSCNPNTWMLGLQVVARRDISKGDELTLDYATFEPTHPEFECWCGAEPNNVAADAPDAAAAAAAVAAVACSSGGVAAPAPVVVDTGGCRRMVRPNEYKEAWFQARYGHHVSPHILSLIQREKEEEERKRKEQATHNGQKPS